VRASVAGFAKSGHAEVQERACFLRALLDAVAPRGSPLPSDVVCGDASAITAQSRVVPSDLVALAIH
jgi:hypothetical protein